MKNHLFVYFSLLFIFLFFGGVAAQTADTTQAQEQAPAAPAPGEIIEAGEAVIQIQVEKPQVQLFSQRIKPEFDEVNLEKSFVKEILDEGQSLTITTKNEEERRQIDLKQMLNKNR
jgi:hypothetical protein